MMNKLLSFFSWIKKEDTLSDEALVQNAYRNRKEEIESLRKHDSGEKTIVAPRLKDITRRV